MTDPRTHQIGGDHYQGFAIPPLDFIVGNRVEFLAGNTIKRLLRHERKDGRLDLEKAAHECALAIQYAKAMPGRMSARDFCTKNGLDVFQTGVITSIMDFAYTGDALNLVYAGARIRARLDALA